jgi:hypothetical protein
MTNMTLASRPIAAILSRTPDLFDREIGVARHAAAAIDECLRAAPLGLSSALDRAFRDRNLHRSLGLNFITLHPAQVARLDALGPLRPTALAIASMVRSGHVREAAVRGLCEHDDPVVLAFLLNRLNDYVGGIARIAWAGLEQRMRPSHAALFVRCLPLLGRMNLWVRADKARCEQLHAFLLRPHPDCRQALWDGLKRPRQRGLPPVGRAAAARAPWSSRSCRRCSPRRLAPGTHGPDSGPRRSPSTSTAPHARCCSR